MEVERFEWRDENVAKLLAHGVTRDEADELLDVGAWVAGSHEDYPGQVRLYGPTRSGRLLTIALAPTRDPVVWRPVTGWPAAEEEIAYYLEEAGYRPRSS